jgi:Icc-related predicted phosphoesterase
MKILAAGDLHGDRTLVAALAKQADEENVDLVVLCGDLVKDEEDTSGVVGAFNKPVFLVHGNHESNATANFLADLYPHAENIQGLGVKVQDIGFIGCSSVNLGIWQMSENKIFNIVKKSKNYLTDCKTKVVVSHVHPAQSKSTFVSGFEGSHGLRKAIDEFEPEIVLCSHVGEAEGIEEVIGNTKVINVGRKGKVIEL